MQDSNIKIIEKLSDFGEYIISGKSFYIFSECGVQESAKTSFENNTVVITTKGGIFKFYISERNFNEYVCFETNKKNIELLTKILKTLKERECTIQE